MAAGDGYSALAGGSPPPANIAGARGSSGARFLAERNPDAGETRQRNLIFQAMGQLPKEPRLLFTSQRVRAIQEIRRRAQQIQELAKNG